MIKELRVSNYRTLEKVTVKYEPGAIGLLGPNGSGKSSLISALYFGITGTPLGSDKKKDVLNWKAKKGYVALDIEAGKVTYTVTRYLPGVRVVLTSTDPEENKDLKEMSVAEINEFLLSLLGGININTLQNVVFSEQGKIERMLACTPAERLDQMIRIFHLDQGEALREQYKERIQELSIIDIPEAEERVNTLRTTIETLKQAAKEHAGIAKALEEKMKKVLSSNQDTLRRSESQVKREIDHLQESILEDMDEKEELTKVIKTALTRDEILEVRIVHSNYKEWNREQSKAKYTIEELEPVEDPDTIQDKVRDANAELKGALARIDSFKRGKCLTCGNTKLKAIDIDKEKEGIKALRKSIAKLDAELVLSLKVWNAKEVLKKPFECFGVSDKDLKRFIKIDPETLKLAECKEELERKLEEIGERIKRETKELLKLKKELLSAIPDAKYKEAKKQIEEIEEISKDISEERSAEATDREKANNLAEDLKELCEDIEESKEASKEAQILNRCRDILHRENLPRVAASTLVEAISPRMCYYASLLGLPYPIKFTNNLDIVYEYEGKDRPFMALSGGQKVAVAIAFRLALVELMANDIGLLVLDEPTANLDNKVVSNFANVMEKVSALAKEKKMIVEVSTHEEQLERALTKIINLNQLSHS